MASSMVAQSGEAGLATATSNTCSNKLGFLSNVSFVPWEWHTLGSAFTGRGKSASSISQILSGRCNFVLRQGFDAVDQSITGRVVEGSSDLGIGLRTKTLAASLTASNLTFHSGLDDPVASARAGGAVPSLKATLAKELGEDTYAAVSYDFKLKKPEVSLCWSGDAITEKATLCINVDPVMRSVRIGAAVEFPGPDWRDDLYDEENDVLETPEDDGCRHRLWVQHEIRNKEWLYKTHIGGRFDLHRLLNNAAEYIDNNIEPLLPPLFWAIPFSRTLYNFLIPGQDEKQERYRLHGWDVGVSHDFDRPAPAVALTKSFSAAAVSIGYDVASKGYSVTYARPGVQVTAKLGKLEGLGWKSPSLHFHVEPLSLF